MSEPSVLLIYTGGTIGMRTDPATGLLKAFDFDHLKDQIPELAEFKLQLDEKSFDTPIDSSNMSPRHWVQIAEIIRDHYDQYDGFVVLHGSDTMAYTASALSFMLQNLTKPVILTGSQLPVGMIRTDGKENLITAIEIAGSKQNGEAIVQEVALYFEYKLYRGNRTHKSSAKHFEAFESPNYPFLANAGVHIDYNWGRLYRSNGDESFSVHTEISDRVGILFLYPGMSLQIVQSILGNDHIDILVLLTYGAGNAPSQNFLVEELNRFISKGKVVLNVTQCATGEVEMSRYETSRALLDIGVVGGRDLTLEAALTKSMYLLGSSDDMSWIKDQLSTPMRGEMSSGT